MGPLDGLAAAGAALRVFADGVVLVRAEAGVASFADGLRDCGDLERGKHVLVIDGHLGAVRDAEGVAGLLAGRKGGLDELGGLRGGSAGLWIAAEIGKGTGKAVRGVGRVVLELCLGDGAHGLDGAGLIGLLAQLEELWNGQGHEDQHDRHNDQQLDQRETFVVARLLRPGCHRSVPLLHVVRLVIFSARTEYRKARRRSGDEVGAIDFEGTEVAKHGECQLVGLEEVAGESLDLCSGDAVDVSDDLIDAKEATVVHLLACEVGHATAGALETHDNIAAELVFGTGEFGLRDGLGSETQKLMDRKLDDFARLLNGGACVDAKRASVTEGTHLRVDGVGKAAVFADGLEQAGAHAAAEDGVHQIKAVAAGITDRRRGDAEADLDLLERPLALEGDMGVGGRRRVARKKGIRVRVEGTEAARDLFDERVVLEITSGGEDHGLCGEAAGMLVKKNLSREAGDRLGGAEDRPAERVSLPELLGEDLVDEVVRVILVHLDLFKDDTLLAGDVFSGEGGMEDEIRENIEGRIGLLFKHLDVEADVFLAGEGVKVAAHAVHFAGDLLRGAGGGALEDHMFDEVGDAVAFGGLIARPAGDPNAHGEAVHVVHAFGENEQTVGEDGATDIARGGANGAPFRAEDVDRRSRSGHETPCSSILSQACGRRL